MERLRKLLIGYNKKHIQDFNELEWALQYCKEDFPKYWKVVYLIAQILPKNLRILEIGSGYGFITSIFLYLQFSNIKGYEANKDIASTANKHLTNLFNTKEIIIPERYISQINYTDVLVIVNCVYVGNCKDKKDYKNRLLQCYENNGLPMYFILETIDSSYTKSDSDFPEYIRLNHKDIVDMFPNSTINSWVTYEYPQNKKSKTLYLIKTK